MKGRAACAALIVLGLVSALRAQEVHLEFAQRPRLIDCDGYACFRLEVNAVDGQGQPSPLDENTVFTMSQGGREIALVRPTFLRRTVRTPGARGSAPAGPRRVSLILFDTSGSMNERLPGGGTKFSVAKGQLERLFGTFQDGVDQMAIAPFDSARVAERIQNAGFEKTKAGLRQQMENLVPRPKGNTALFSAVSEGLQRLKPFTGGDAQITLVVFTDGKNDVDHPADDRGLLSGAAGLQKVRELAQDVGVTVYTIGYGAAGVSFDEAALQALKFPQAASNYFNARDESRLAQIFNTIARRGGTAVRLLVGPMPLRREQLAGSIRFVVAAGTLSAESPSWDANPLMPTPFEGTMTPEEQKAWLARLIKDGPGGTPIPSYIIRVAVLVIYSGLLAALWFVLPRQLWPERYIPKPAFRPAPTRAPQPRPGPRPGAVAGAPAARPSPPRPDAARPPGRPAPAVPDRLRPSAPGGRGREAPPSAPPERPREGWGQRDAGDATVFIPPSKKPGGQA